MKINCAQLLAQVKKDSQEMIQVAQDSFGTLNEDTLYWKPAPNKWSVGECLEHLNITFRSYMPKITTGIDKGIAKSWAPTTDFQPGWIGKKFTNSFRLDESGQPKRRVKTFKSLDSSKLPERNPKVREEFIIHVKNFIEQTDRAAQVNLQKVRVTSVIGAVLRFKLGDALQFITVHNQRHLMQAQKVLEARG
ncbi:DinB family protein [Microscilla marina]|uniref:DinB-like domain-containing protein n=1 Tax=Microscilla marina ATCC 23134 TaxID=313606 RepID=A1ZXE8_MICM2|nr:DinB family protein [Microscilla marina]EAY24916.1 hypothetical protein M23134_04955 [Microscilla marina ATCC 23134]